MQRTALDEVDPSSGAFKRKPSTYRHIISESSNALFTPDAHRYCLYVSLACPWANRCVATYYLKGLQDVIMLSVVHPVWARTRPTDTNDTHCGWQFANPDDPPVSTVDGYGSFPCDGCVADPLGLPNLKYIRQLYEISDDNSPEEEKMHAEKFTVPVLFDSKTKRIVNNESSDILRMLNGAFNHLATNPSLDLYPVDLRPKIDSMNDMVYESINNGVYKCGFATSQGAYEAAHAALFDALEECDGKILSKSRYLCGDVLTEADIRLFMTLIRFDAVYVVYFKTNGKMLKEFPHLREYVKDLYSIPEIQKSINMDHIKNHYFASHPKLNPYGIVPAGPFEAWWTDGHHNRHKMTKQALSWTIE